jgi:hypothetical protein
MLVLPVCGLSFGETQGTGGRYLLLAKENNEIMKIITGGKNNEKNT